MRLAKREGFGRCGEARASTRSPTAGGSVSFASSLRLQRALTCSKTAALEVCLIDAKTACHDACRRSEMPPKIFFQLELRLNFVWYNIAQTQPKGGKRMKRQMMTLNRFSASMRRTLSLYWQVAKVVDEMV